MLCYWCHQPGGETNKSRQHSICPCHSDFPGDWHDPDVETVPAGDDPEDLPAAGSDAQPSDAKPIRRSRPIGECAGSRGKKQRWSQQMAQTWLLATAIATFAQPSVSAGVASNHTRKVHWPSFLVAHSEVQAARRENPNWTPMSKPSVRSDPVDIDLMWFEISRISHREARNHAWTDHKALSMFLKRSTKTFIRVLQKISNAITNFHLNDTNRCTSAQILSLVPTSRSKWAEEYI